jgi:cell wall-associated NlpC family hydrolase
MGRIGGRTQNRGCRRRATFKARVRQLTWEADLEGNRVRTVLRSAGLQWAAIVVALVALIITIMLPSGSAPAAAATPTQVHSTVMIARLGTVPQAKPTAAQIRKAQIQTLRMKLVKVAKAQIGDRYSAGSAGPNAFDCSGLTRYVYKQVTGKTLPHQSRSQFSIVKKIRTKDAQPGDLVFFFKRGAHHVGIYIGGGKMVDAAGRGKGVRVSPIHGSWWGRTFSGIGRVVPAA